MPIIAEGSIIILNPACPQEGGADEEVEFDQTDPEAWVAKKAYKPAYELMKAKNEEQATEIKEQATEIESLKEKLTEALKAAPPQKGARARQPVDPGSAVGGGSKRRRSGGR
tara:strand:- start:256 stop:591 length:336 start_codon:yes stop_codon:yes gene_type:complete